MRESTRAFVLGPLLKGVSRSFYLTLRILPGGMRDPIGLAYLLARAADTIADTSLIAPDRRLVLLLALRAQVNGTATDNAVMQQLADEVASQQTQSDEKVLLESLGPALEILAAFTPSDRQAVREIVSTLSDGMELDLRTFPDERAGHLVALREWDELDRYTYLVAGCVGEFWTQMTYAHMPGTLRIDATVMIARGIRFGKALQLTNVLRDCGKDLRMGRCYLPSTLLDQVGLRPNDLLSPSNASRAQPVLRDVIRATLDHYQQAIDYMLAFPATSIRMRLACLWPIVIGLETLLLLVDNAAWLDPAKVSKITRGKVYRVIARSVPYVLSDALLRAWTTGLMQRIEQKISAGASLFSRPLRP